MELAFFMLTHHGIKGITLRAIPHPMQIATNEARLFRFGCIGLMRLVTIIGLVILMSDLLSPHLCHKVFFPFDWEE